MVHEKCVLNFHATLLFFFQEPTTHDLEQYRTCILEISDKDNDGKLSKEELELLLFANKSKDES